MSTDDFKQEIDGIAAALEGMTPAERATFFNLLRALEIKHRPRRPTVEALTDYSDRLTQELNGGEVSSHAILCITHDALTHRWELSSNLLPESLHGFCVDVERKLREEVPTLLEASATSRARGGAVVIVQCRGCGVSREISARELTPGEPPRCEQCGDVMGHILVDAVVKPGERKAS